VIVTTAGGAPVTYRVTETLIVPEAEYRDVVLAASTEPGARQLSLFACHPEGDRTHRIVVRALA
jgi:sortase A